MISPHFEYNQIKQPATIELYVEKLKEMSGRTLIKYESRWASLLSRENGVDLSDKIKSVVNRVISDAKKFEIRPSTYRVYKAAICYGLASTYLKIENDMFPDSDMGDGISFQLLSNLYKEVVNQKIEYQPAKLYKHKTSSLKKKSFPLDFYNYLKDKQKSCDKKLNPRFILLMEFIDANLIVGLRPIEWLTVSIASKLETKCMVFLVKNAKNSNGRANGYIRELELEGITKDQELSLIKFYSSFHRRLYDAVQKFNVAHERYKENSSYILKKNTDVLSVLLLEYEPTILKDIPKSDICDKNNIPQNGLAEIVLSSLQNEMFFQYNEFIKVKEIDDSHRVSLYSTRHQCIANAKSSKVNPYKIAAFFGHSSKETSTRHYGKAWSGWSKFTFSPSIESIMAVNGSGEYLAKEYGISNIQIPNPDSIPDLRF